MEIDGGGFNPAGERKWLHDNDYVRRGILYQKLHINRLSGCLEH